MQPDPALQYNTALRKAKQPAALSASLLSSWALTPASPGALSCQKPSLLPTCAREESSIPEEGGAGTQARRNSLTFLNRLSGSISISSGSRLPPGPRRRSGTSASYIAGETEWGGWVGGLGGWGEQGPGKLSTKASRMTLLQSCRGLSARGPGGCLLLACLFSSPPSREREETLSRFQEEHENLTPASRSLSLVQKYIPMETDRIPRWAVGLQFSEDGLHIFWFPLLQIKYTWSTKRSFSIFSVSWIAVDLGSYVFFCLFVLVVVGLPLDGEI